MRKTLLVLALLCLSVGTLFAQQTAIEKSEEFDEPRTGWNKLMQLKNGNTLFLHSTPKDGIEVTVYDSKRKLIATTDLESKLWDIDKLRKTKIEALYEINGQPVLFVIQADDKMPTLYRMCLDPNTGAVKREDEVGHLPKTSIWQGYAMVFGGVDASDIIVEKDPNSDCYAVIIFNGFARNRSERIKVIHYDGNHKVINTAYYESPGGKFKYLRYIGSVVDGDKRVFVTTYGHNGKTDDVASRVIVSRLNVGDSSFKHNLLNFSEDFDQTESVMLYNHYNNSIQLLTLTLTKSKHSILSSKTTRYYLSLLSYINPETLELKNVKQLNGQMINTYGIKNIDKDYEFNGVPQQMLINRDNTTTILYEEMTQVTERSGHTVMIYTNLGPIGVSELSDTGAEMHGYAISKKQRADGILSKLYINKRTKGTFMYLSYGKKDQNEFLSYDYINAPDGRYVIFNDLPRNADKDETEESRKTVKYVSATNTMCYKLNDPKMDKFYLFGEPDSKNTSTFCYITSSNYNQDINTYATLIVERDGRSKSARIAWVKFQ